MQDHYTTGRLVMDRITPDAADFILTLVNTPGWLRFIGDRNVRTQEDAKAYIQKIIDNPQQYYWTVNLKEENTPIGVITFLKREYLEHYDIGFAFLPEHVNKGYAYEAAMSVLEDVIVTSEHKTILATTVKENQSSIKLLERMGLRFEKEIRNGDDLLSVYSVSVDKLLLDRLTRNFYSLFTNAKQQALAIDNIWSLCFPGCRIVKKAEGKEEFYSLETFIEPRRIILSDGTLTEFEEYEVFEETRISGNIAQRFSRYRKKGFLNGSFFEAGGCKLFQYVRSGSEWKISSLLWEDEMG